MLLLTIYETYLKGSVMTKIIKVILTVVFCLISGGSFLLPAYAESVNSYYPPEELLCISYRGDTAEYEANSKEAVLSAFVKGADFVSVSIRKSDSGELVLCSENKPEAQGVALSEMLAIIDEENELILDFDSALKDEIYDLLKAENVLSKAYLRIKDSAGNISEWISSKDEEVRVIGVCSSFNVFTVCSFANNLSYLPAIQMQSKNHFNVMYDAICNNLYADKRVIAPMYDPDLCGQRSDSEDGWNDLIKRNFTIIETNNLEAFIDYKSNEIELRKNLASLLKKAETINPEAYSLVSRENLAEGIENAKMLAQGGAASCDELQKTQSALILAMNNMTLKQGEDTQKGALNITAGKVIATVLVGIAILAAQIYTYKMQKGKKNKEKT